jgi:hypothetical protein
MSASADEEIMESSTRAGGFCLCRRGFNRRGFWVFGFQSPGFVWMGDRIFCGWAIGFLVDGLYRLRQRNRVFGRICGVRSSIVEKTRFLGRAIGFCVDGRSGFVWMGDRVSGIASFLSSDRLETNHPHPIPTAQNTDCKPHYPVPKAAANKHFESPPSLHQHQQATEN